MTFHSTTKQGIFGMFSRKKKDDDALPVEKGKEEIVPAVVPVGKEQDKKGPGK